MDISNKIHEKSVSTHSQTVPVRINEMVEEGILIDTCYQHEICASFGFGVELDDSGHQYVLWIEHEDPEEREFPDEERFWITKCSNETLNCIFATDDFEEILDKISELLKENLNKILMTDEQLKAFKAILEYFKVDEEFQDMVEQIQDTHEGHPKVEQLFENGVPETWEAIPKEIQDMVSHIYKDVALLYPIIHDIENNNQENSFTVGV